VNSFISYFGVQLCSVQRHEVHICNPEADEKFCDTKSLHRWI